MQHTDYSTPELFDKFYCAKVSHHHYWFETYREYYEFTKSNWYDLRMTLSTPNNPTERT